MDDGKITADRLPSKYRPLGMWEYFAYSILFMIQPIGLVFLVIFSFDGSNINRRNYARSFFCGLILFVILVAILASAGVLGLLLAWLLPDEGGITVTILNALL